MASNGPAPRYSFYFDHLSRTGRWTRQALPTVAGMTAQFAIPSSMAWIPGTSSVRATGYLTPQHGNGAVFVAIFKYGP
jgi:hypothetical protein